MPEITANELVDFDLSAWEAERGRIAQLISGVSHLPYAAKEDLVRELMDIVLNKLEDPSRRVRATAILGVQTQALDVEGSTNIADLLLNVVEGEFFTKVSDGGCRTIASLQNLDGIQLLFFEFLAHAVLRIEPLKTKQIVNAIYVSTRGRDGMPWATEFLEKAKRQGISPDL